MDSLQVPCWDWALYKVYQSVSGRSIASFDKQACFMSLTAVRRKARNEGWSVRPALSSDGKGCSLVGMGLGG